MIEKFKNNWNVLISKSIMTSDKLTDIKTAV